MKTLKDLKITEGEWKFECDYLSGDFKLVANDDEVLVHEGHSFLHPNDDDAKLIELAPLMRDVCLSAQDLINSITEEVFKEKGIDEIFKLKKSLNKLNERLNDE